MIRQHNVTQMATARVIDDLGSWLATIEDRYDIPAHAKLTRRFDATRPPEVGRAWIFSWDWQADDPEPPLPWEKEVPVKRTMRT